MGTRMSEPNLSTESANRAPLRFGEFVTLIASMMALTALGIDSMLPALPAIGDSLGVAEPNHRQFVITAFLVGFAVWLVMLFWPGVSVDVRRPELVLWFGLMGSLLLAFLGLLTSIWADKFDHAAAVTNFVVTPLALLSGTFYSVRQLSPTFRESVTPIPFST